MYIWRLEAANTIYDDDRYDLVERGAGGHLQFDLSDQLRVCTTASSYQSHFLSSANELL